MTPGASAPTFSWRPFALWVALFAALGAPLVFNPRASNLSSDEATYYLPAIAQIRSHWPRLDLVGDSLSATGPGYAYALATASFVTGSSVPALRAVNWLVSLGVLAALWSLLRRRGGPALTLALAPLALSNFFVKSSGWVVTDNCALLFTTLAVVALLFDERPSALRRSALAAAGAVAVRQVGIWLAAPLALRGWTDSPSPGRRGRNLLWLLLPLAPLLCFVVAWHGTVPPAWQSFQLAEGGFSLTPVVYLLAVLASLGFPFYLAATDAADWRDAARERWIWTLAAAGLALALAVSTVPDHGAGRWGGYWWSLAARLPVFGHVSPVFLALAPAGAWLAGALGLRLWRTCGPRPTLLWLAAVAAWAATTLVNRLVFHRYFEPPLLVFLLCWLALLAAPGRDFRLTRRWPLLALALGQLGLTFVTVHAQAFGLVHPE